MIYLYFKNNGLCLVNCPVYSSLNFTSKVEFRLNFTFSWNGPAYKFLFVEMMQEKVLADWLVAKTVTRPSEKVAVWAVKAVVREQNCSRLRSH